MLNDAAFDASDRPSDVSDRTPQCAGRVRLHEVCGIRRLQLEQFIASRFAEVYGAEIHAFMPQLHGMYDADDQLLAAFGLRAGGDHPFFLEQYLDQPIEEIIAQRTGLHPQRGEIAEVGNLAGASSGALRQLIPLLTRLLHSQGFRWVVFTGAARLCNGFSRLGLPLAVLTPAPAERLPAEERARWGSYYRHRPAVMLGDVLEGQRQLAEMADSDTGLDKVLAPLARVGTP